jgi:Coenzyme PQQ synthesis protein D (PqqD)
MEPMAPNQDLTNAFVGVPRHVVYRDFASETVLLNIDTGTYHGLNPVAGRMLETLDKLGSVRESITALAREFEQPDEVIERDLTELCDGLIQRGLLEVRQARP